MFEKRIKMIIKAKRVEDWKSRTFSFYPSKTSRFVCIELFFVVWSIDFLRRFSRLFIQFLEIGDVNTWVTFVFTCWRRFFYWIISGFAEGSGSTIGTNDDGILAGLTANYDTWAVWEDGKDCEAVYGESWTENPSIPGREKRSGRQLGELVNEKFKNLPRNFKNFFCQKSVLKTFRKKIEFLLKSSKKSEKFKKIGKKSSNIVPKKFKHF